MKNMRINSLIATATIVATIVSFVAIYIGVRTVNDEYYNLGYEDGKISTDAYSDGFKEGSDLQKQINESNTIIREHNEEELKKRMEKTFKEIEQQEKEETPEEREKIKEKFKRFNLTPNSANA
jgi:hypothetical protein